MIYIVKKFIYKQIIILNLDVEKIKIFMENNNSQDSNLYEFNIKKIINNIKCIICYNILLNYYEGEIMICENCRQK